jgi:hypothetical protein
VLVYVTGLPGSGKSTLCEALNVRGYSAVDADDHFGAWISRRSGELLADPPAFADRTRDFYAQNEWRYSLEQAARFNEAHADAPCFVGGFAARDADLARLATKTFFLQVEDELRRRIMSRTNEPFARASNTVRLAQANRVLPEKARVEEAWLAKGFEPIDGSRPPEAVVDDLLMRCELRPPADPTP